VCKGICVCACVFCSYAGIRACVRMLCMMCVRGHLCVCVCVLLKCKHVQWALRSAMHQEELLDMDTCMHAHTCTLASTHTHTTVSPDTSSSLSLENPRASTASSCIINISSAWNCRSFFKRPVRVSHTCSRTMDIQAVMKLKQQSPTPTTVQWLCRQQITSHVKIKSRIHTCNRTMVVQAPYFYTHTKKLKSRGSTN
jgi:hypothetical protein